MINHLLKDRKTSVEGDNRNLATAKRVMTIASLGSAVRILKDRNKSDLNINDYR